MKKQLLSIAILALASTCAQAQVQPRLALYEEFTGENCGPCAASNPTLEALVNGSGNASKIIMIKYQSPIPTAGPIYNAYKTVTDARLLYYGVNFAPYGRLDGIVLGSGANAGHVSFMSQAAINTEASAVSPFNITVSHVWNATGDSITANVSITANAAYAPTGAQLKLRVALVEHLTYCAAPGTNGETDFPNVVREMYPDANGTTLANSWTASQTQNLTLKGRVPTMVDKSNSEAMVIVWIQNDADKSVAQAAVSTVVPLATDAALTGCSSAKLACLATGVTSLTSSVPVTLKNTGTSTLTSATIYYKLDNGTSSSQAWTGTLAPGATASTTVSVTATAGNHTVYDSVGAPNGAADINTVNNTKAASLAVHDGSLNALPIMADFEATTLPSGWLLFDGDGNGENWARRTGSSHNGSSAAIYHRNYSFTSGEVNYAILPMPTLPAGAKALDFYEAYAQYSTENDALDVVYSTDCGANWTSVWNASGAGLATHPAITTEYVPAAADWKLVSVDMTNVPTGAMIALRATSDYGNNLYIDDVNLRTGAPTGISQVISGGAVSIYPNPATEAATLQLAIVKDSKVNVGVLDAVGRTVLGVFDGNLNVGSHQIAIPTNSLSAGVYNVVIRTSEGNITRHLSVVK